MVNPRQPTTRTLVVVLDRRMDDGIGSGEGWKENRADSSNLEAHDLQSLLLLSSATHDARAMDNADEDDDIKLAKASIGLLNSLEQDIPKLLYKSALTGTRSKRVHTRVKRRHLDHVVNLVRYSHLPPKMQPGS